MLIETVTTQLCCDCVIATGSDQCVTALDMSRKYLLMGYCNDQWCWLEGEIHRGRGKSELSYQAHPGGELTGYRTQFLTHNSSLGSPG